MVDDRGAGSWTYAFEDAPSNVGLNVVLDLLDLGLNLVLDLQCLAGLNVQEAVVIDIAQGVEEFRLGKSILGVIRGSLERDTGLRKGGGV